MTTTGSNTTSVVFGDDSLLGCITAFQTGYPHAVKAMVGAASDKHLQQAREQLDGAFSRLAILTGDAKTLKLLFDLRTRSEYYRRDPMLNFADAMRTAIRLKSIEMLDCIAELMARDPTWHWGSNLLPYTLHYAGGDRRLLEWLYQRLPEDKRVLQSYDMVAFARDDNVEGVQWLLAHGCVVSPYAMDCLAAHLSPSVMVYMYKHTEVRCSPQGVVDAAESGALETVKLVTVGQTEVTCMRAINAAARAGRLDVVTYFVENAIGVNSTVVIDEAAEGGNLGVVEYLHKHIVGGCTWDAMDRAATGGHLDVVKFLHESRSEGCTSNAMDGAAAHGHLEVVKFLHDNRIEGCTEAAHRLAAMHSHLEVVRFLCEHRHECDIGSAATEALLDVLSSSQKYQAPTAKTRKLCTQVVKYLCQKQEERGSAGFLISAAGDGVDWVVEVVAPFATDAELKQARACAMRRKQLRIVRILDCELHERTGERE